MKNTNHIIGNRNRDLPTCRAVHQPTALQRGGDVNKRAVLRHIIGTGMWHGFHHLRIALENGICESC